MRLLIVSDIHANLVAFEAVLKAANGQWDQIWCLGDVIGYGPRPNACVALLREHDHISLSGNHDWAALGKLGIDDFNEDARVAVRWTHSVLTPETKDYLDELPAKRVIDDYTLAHASPRQPVWEYVLDFETAAANFAEFDTPYCLIGHSHVQLFVAETEPGAISSVAVKNDEPFLLQDARFMINPGSVGQPRDGDPRAAYALLDTDTMAWEFHRVAYAVEETQRQMRDANLPEPLVKRLAYGW